MNKYQAVDSTGNLYKRGSKTRTYTHCVIAEYTNGYIESTWAGNADLAASRAQTFNNKRHQIGKKDKYGCTYQNEVVRVEVLEAKEV
jgi:hypothetical protein